jgi:hypothetical protein
MSKKEKPKSKNKIILIGLLLIAGFGFWSLQKETIRNWKEQALNYIDNRDIITLEARFLPEKILDEHLRELVGKDNKSLRQTTLKYYPYLLLDIKYTDDQKTREGVLLWGLNDGEVVLNTDNWESTHGFYDCLECQASRTDFKLIHALGKKHGSSSIEELQRELKIEREIVENWIEEAKKKHLIVQKGAQINLHFENPKLVFNPQTKVKHPLVSKPFQEGEKATRKFNRSQILALAHAAFGND